MSTEWLSDVESPAPSSPVEMPQEMEAQHALGQQLGPNMKCGRLKVLTSNFAEPNIKHDQIHGSDGTPIAKWHIVLACFVDRLRLSGVEVVR